MKVGEHRRVQDKPSGISRVVSLMATYERPGMLTATVKSYLTSDPNPPHLIVFDDGSQSDAKQKELKVVRTLGVTVMELEHAGFITTWRRAFNWAARSLSSQVDGLVLLEDDLSFAKGWLDVLKRMHNGVYTLGLKPGAMSCLRVHSVPQNTVVNLNGIEAYQSMMHGFQVNLVPFEVILRWDIFEESEAAARAGQHGIDVHWLGNLSHRLGLTNFVSMQSWVAHEGARASIVTGQGYKSFEHRGYNLVEELCRDNGDLK